MPTLHRGLPRTRGDGPGPSVSIGLPEQASPHTRGWTPSPSCPRRPRGGFPAHAGMDPPDPPACRRGKGLPRTRGDGPRVLPHAWRRREASPHTRGWTLAVRLLPMPHPGFPAHAGMDPTAGDECAPRLWLPRTRGDGPDHVGAEPLAEVASPHTRGWTRPQDVLQALAGGFPAHAGMDPRYARHTGYFRGLPRTRGDGPYRWRAQTWFGPASPHTRGWTQRRSGVPAVGIGFPAHAGMDRVGLLVAGDFGRLPRTRGDGPVSSAQSLIQTEASPHTRGWTRECRRVAARLDGFPAHAGMDRLLKSRRPRRCWLPRTRGDGPEKISTSATVRMASPHTRGWTRRRRRDVGPGGGFPAHAGMDPAASYRA